MGAYTKKFKAFSLIELMVVIAIVALLAAIAVPSYQKYVLKAKVNAIAQLVDGLKTQAIEYGNLNNSFPTGDQLGYDTGGSGTTLVDPTAVGPNVTQAVIARVPLCSNLPFMGQLAVMVDASDFGLANSNYVISMVVYEDENGITNSFCFEGDEVSVFPDHSNNSFCDDPGIAYDDIGTFLTALPGCN